MCVRSDRGKDENDFEFVSGAFHFGYCSPTHLCNPKEGDCSGPSVQSTPTVKPQLLPVEHLTPEVSLCQVQVTKTLKPQEATQKLYFR